jgi:hypothetical protein
VPPRFLRFKLRGSSEPSRAPLVERLLACADKASIAPDWRADAFAVLAPGTALPCIAPVALCAAGIAPAAISQASAWVCLATPVHYQAELSNVRFADDGILSLDAAEAATLARNFNTLWHGAGVHLWAASHRLFCGFGAPLQVMTQDPELARGRHLESFLPTGPDAAHLRRLMSELEMWLFDHAVNDGRRNQSRLAISGLWLWGGGAPLASLPVVQGGAAGVDVLFDSFPAGTNRAADVMVVEAVPGGEAWGDIESAWLEPTLADLRRGQLTRLELSAGSHRFTLSARWRRRFWRRTKPWWEYFE